MTFQNSEKPIMLVTLPDDLKEQISIFLAAPDVLNLLSTHRNYHDDLGKTTSFWEILLRRDTHGINSADVSSTDNSAIAVKAAKKLFLVNALSAGLSSVKWRPVNTNLNIHAPSSREGHLMCLLGPPSKRKILVTGGFSSDHSVHMLEVTSNPNAPRRFKALQPSGRNPSFVYGASLTAIDERRAIRFGGFRAGGYSQETAECCLLVLEDDDDGGSRVRWENLTIQGQAPSGRAYHTATLINNRYLIIIGGMKTRESILDEAILDVQTFTWVETSLTHTVTSPLLSGRHGHSVVADVCRNRLVLFGGGSGSDLLRSGVDNAEVWELKMGDNWDSDFESSLPWEWQRIHGDPPDEIDETDEEENEHSNLVNEDMTSRLSRVERLNLGRCHIGVKVSLNTVLFVFGSGRPPTNGVLAYNLQSNTFHRPRVDGPIPQPRFTAAAVLLDGNGWLVAFGGYSVLSGGNTLNDVVVLDLAPGMNRMFPSLATFSDDDDDEVESFAPITDRNLPQRRQGRQVPIDTGEMLVELMAARPEQRQQMASAMLGQLMAQGDGGRTAFMLAMVANGNAVLGYGNDDDDDDDDDDA